MAIKIKKQISKFPGALWGPETIQAGHTPATCHFSLHSSEVQWGLMKYTHLESPSPESSLRASHQNLPKSMFLLTGLKTYCKAYEELAFCLPKAEAAQHQRRTESKTAWPSLPKDLETCTPLLCLESGAHTGWRAAMHLP